MESADTQVRDDGAVGRLPGLSTVAADGLSQGVSEPPPPPYVFSSPQAVPAAMVTRLPPALYQEQHAGLLAHEPAAQVTVQSASTTLSAAAAAPAINEQAYAEACKRTCVGLGGVMGTLERGSRSASVGLQDVFVAQDVQLLDSFSLADHFELPAQLVDQLRMSGQLELLEPEVQQRMQAHMDYSFSNLSRSVMDVLSDASLRWVVILGSPGSGKSTALRAHLLAWAAASPAERERLDFPVLVELRKYARDRHHASTLLQYMSLSGGEARTPLDIAALQAMLQPSSGRRVLLLLDGLDEVFDVRLRAQVVEDVQLFVNQHRGSSVRVVLTSRIVGYSARQLQAYDFTHHVLQPLDSDQIVDFVRRWHAAVYAEAEAETRKSREERLVQVLKRSDPLLQLASSPLLLSMIALVNDSRELPTQRASLYAECSRLLLERWKIEEAVQAVEKTAGASITLFTRAHKEALLVDLAWRMQHRQDSTGMANLVPQDVLEAVVLEHVQLQGLRQAEPKLVAQALITQLRERHHVICWLGAQSFAFVHRTFLEYYAALYVQQWWEAGRMSQAQLVQLFLQHPDDYDWQEVLELLGGMLPSEVVYPCVEALAAGKLLTHLYLAARCLTELQKRNEAAAVEHLIRQKLETAVRQDRRSFYIKLLVQLWPDGRTRALLEGVSLGRQTRSAETAVSELAARWPDHRTRAMLEQVARSSCGVASTQAVHQLCKHWKDSRALAMLERVATSYQPWVAPWTAAAALGALERDCGYTLEAMQTAAHWRKRGGAEGADERVREIVRRAGGVKGVRAMLR